MCILYIMYMCLGLKPWDWASYILCARASNWFSVFLNFPFFS